MNAITFVLIFSLFVYTTQCAKILGVFPYPSKSHHILGSALLKELAGRGHEVTMLSPYPVKNPPKNYHDVDLKIDFAAKDRNMKILMSDSSLYQKFELFRSGYTILNRGVLENVNLRAFLDSKPTFDVVIQPLGLNEALLGIGHAVNASTINFSVIGWNPLIIPMTANPTPYSYVPHTFLPYTDKMSFIQRVLNTITFVTGEIFINYINLPYQEKILKEFFPDAPPLQTLIDNVDIHLLNSHVSTESPRPLLPNMIQIGGYHLQEMDSLPEELERYLNDSRNGVILFSLGTNLRSEDLSQENIKAILNTFGKLQYDVLWKFEGELSGAPKNLRIIEWLPQRAVLAHKNVKAFVTHGGLGSTVEAIFYGVPMVCMPYFGDQNKNVAHSVKNGYAIKVDMNNFTENSFGSAIREITCNPKYKERALLKSDIYRNQEMNPMDKAVYWVEHVIKHKGAKHMKSRAAEMPLYQYLLLDVIGFLLVCISIVMAILAALVYGGVKLLKRIFKAGSVSNISSNKKAN